MDHAVRMQVLQAFKNVLRPAPELLLLDGLVFAEDSTAEPVRTIASVLHIHAEVLVCLCVVECLHDIGMIHLLVHHAFTLGKLDGQWMRTDLLLISCLEYDVLL